MEPSTAAYRDVTLIPEEARSAVSWGAIFAGATAALALSFVLLGLAAGFGLKLAAPWPGARPSLAEVHPMLGAWMIVVQVLASALGGYLAGRLRTKWLHVHGHEVHFRDTGPRPAGPGRGARWPARCCPRPSSRRPRRRSRRWPWRPPTTMRMSPRSSPSSWGSACCWAPSSPASPQPSAACGATRCTACSGAPDAKCCGGHRLLGERDGDGRWARERPPLRWPNASTRLNRA